MTSPGLPPWARPVAAAGFRETRRRLASVRQQEQELPPLRSFRREVAARTWERLRRETRRQLQAMRPLLHTLFDEVSNDNGPEDGLQAPPWPVYPSPQQKEMSVCTLHEQRPYSKRASFPP